MENSKFEVNEEKLSELSIADLIALEKRFMTDMTETEAEFTSREIAGIFYCELEKRINDIIIF